MITFQFLNFVLFAAFVVKNIFAQLLRLDEQQLEIFASCENTGAKSWVRYSTVTLFARFRGWSTSVPR
jgi:hypothetical protein